MRKKQAETKCRQDLTAMICQKIHNLTCLLPHVDNITTEAMNSPIPLLVIQSYLDGERELEPTEAQLAIAGQIADRN